jgi:hypothetical protein
MVTATGSAHAQPVDSGTLSFSGDPDDYITGGGSYSYDTAASDTFRIFNNNNETVNIQVDGVNGDSWTLTLDAPTGQTLTPGTTYTATRYGRNGGGAGMDLSGNGRGCYFLDGTFTIITALFADNGWVQTFDATFEQHCHGATAAARGEVHITNPPPPPELAIAVSADPRSTVSTVSGDVMLSGTVTCSELVSMSVYGTLTQVVKREIARGNLGLEKTCTPGGPVSWTILVRPSGTTPFIKGDAEVSLNASAYDDTYNRYVYFSVTSVIKLEKA